jgi:hypothetical protein
VYRPFSPAPSLATFAGRRGVGEQRARRGVELRHALLIDAEVAAERIVAAGVEHDDVHRVRGPGDRLDHRVDVDAALLDVLHPSRDRVDRQHVVAPRELHAVPGEVEQPERLRGGETVGVGANRGEHLRAVEIQAEQDLEARALEFLGHRARVVDRVPERIGLVAVVADQR